MFKLTAKTMPKRYSRGRIAVVEAFLDLSVWPKGQVDRIYELINKRGWDNNPEWVETLNKAHDMINAYNKILHFAPSGSLRFALVRKPRRERLIDLRNKVYEYERRRKEVIKEGLGWKNYKTRSAQMKQWTRLKEEVDKDERVIKYREWQNRIRDEISCLR